jgi:hypothetical protein
VGAELPFASKKEKVKTRTLNGEGCGTRLGVEEFPEAGASGLRWKWERLVRRGRVEAKKKVKTRTLNGEGCGARLW